MSCVFLTLKRGMAYAYGRMIHMLEMVIFNGWQDSEPYGVPFEPFHISHDYCPNSIDYPYTSDNVRNCGQFPKSDNNSLFNTNWHSEVTYLFLNVWTNFIAHYCKCILRHAQICLPPVFTIQATGHTLSPTIEYYMVCTKQSEYNSNVPIQPSVLPYMDISVIIIVLHSAHI